jgi:hypothetical protein
MRNKKMARATTFGNGIYRVRMRTPPGNTDVGTSSITSGPDHPAGAGQTFMDYSYNTYHSYTSNTNYVQDSDASSGVLLDPYVTAVTPIGTTGVTVTYTLPGPPDTPDGFIFHHTVIVHGTTFADTRIEVTNTLINGANPLLLGIRYFFGSWIANDFGPAFQAINPTGPILLEETEFIAPTFEYFKLFDNIPGDYPYSIFQTVSGPNYLSPLPSPPTKLQLANWDSSVTVPFLYTIPSPPQSTDDEGAIIYYWGDTEDNAFDLPPDGRVTVSASFFSQPLMPQRGIRLL